MTGYCTTSQEPQNRICTSPNHYCSVPVSLRFTLYGVPSTHVSFWNPLAADEVFHDRQCELAVAVSPDTAVMHRASSPSPLRRSDLPSPVPSCTVFTPHQHTTLAVRWWRLLRILADSSVSASKMPLRDAVSGLCWWCVRSIEGCLWQGAHPLNPEFDARDLELGIPDSSAHATIAVKPEL